MTASDDTAHADPDLEFEADRIGFDVVCRVPGLREFAGEAGNWTLAFELADPANTAAYQGVSQTGAALGSMLGPLLVTVTAIEHGWAGWAVLGALFLTAGLSTLGLTRRGVRRPSSGG